MSMQWFNRQSLYKKNMILAFLLVLFLNILTLFVLWDILVTLDELSIRQLLFRMGMVMFILMLAAERITVKITRPIHSLITETAEISSQKFGIKVDMPTENEKEQLAVVFHTLTEKLADIHDENYRNLAEVGRKKKMRDRLLSKLITVQEDERKRISRELHDEIGQALTALMVSMRAIADSVGDEKQKTVLLGARDLAANTLESIRAMAINLRPPVLDDLGLIPAMKKYIATFMDLHHVRVEFNAKGSERPIGGYTAMALYRIMQECLTNVVRHSAAKEVAVTIEIRDKHVMLGIIDNGKGFVVESIYKRQRENRLGVYGMMERAELLGGTLKIESELGQGTSITVVVPNAGGKPQNGKTDQSNFGG